MGNGCDTREISAMFWGNRCFERSHLKCREISGERYFADGNGLHVPRPARAHIKCSFFLVRETTDLLNGASLTKIDIEDCEWENIDGLVLPQKCFKSIPDNLPVVCSNKYGKTKTCNCTHLQIACSLFCNCKKCAKSVYQLTFISHKNKRIVTKHRALAAAPERRTTYLFKNYT